MNKKKEQRKAYRVNGSNVSYKLYKRATRQAYNLGQQRVMALRYDIPSKDILQSITLLDGIRLLIISWANVCSINTAYKITTRTVMLNEIEAKRRAMLTTTTTKQNKNTRAG